MAATASPDMAKPRRFVGLPIAWVVLTLLVVQNSATALMVASSRRPAADGAPLYLGSAAVFLSECLKLPLCLALIAREEGGVRPMLAAVRRCLLRVGDTAKMAVPALCYLLQNRLLFVSLSRLSATSHQLWSQSKTLFTALFFVRLLGQRLEPAQWLALLLLSLGVCTVQLGEAAGSAPPAGGSLLGVAAVLSSSLLSGFANIYFEKVLKEAAPPPGASTSAPPPPPPPSLWMRNVQLGLFSIPQAALLLLADRSAIVARGPLQGFSPLVWAVVASTAFGGLLVAAVVKHADNIVKMYAAACAIVLTCAVTSIVTASPPSALFLSGMALVLGSLLLYNQPVATARTAAAAAAAAAAATAPSTRTEPESDELDAVANDPTSDELACSVVSTSCL